MLPEAAIDDVLTEAARIQKRERVLIEAAQQPGFDLDAIKAAYQTMFLVANFDELRKDSELAELMVQKLVLQELLQMMKVN